MSSQVARVATAEDVLALRSLRPLHLTVLSLRSPVSIVACMAMAGGTQALQAWGPHLLLLLTWEALSLLAARVAIAGDMLALPSPCLKQLY